MCEREREIDKEINADIKTERYIKRDRIAKKKSARAREREREREIQKE